MAALPGPAWAWTPHVIHRSPDDELFSEGDALCRPHCKQMAVSTHQDHEQCGVLSDQGKQTTFKCQAVDCRSTFNSIRQYESHYNSQHRHPCTDCRRSFPTSHLLDVHITEWHDPMFDLLCHSRNMYKCLVESCLEKFQTYQQRKDHIMSQHKYPANFRFDRPPRDKKQINTSKLQQKSRETHNHDSMEIAESMETSDRSTHMSPTNSSSLTKVPMSLTSLARGSLSKQTLSARSELLNTGVDGRNEHSDSMDTDQTCSDGSIDVNMESTAMPGRKFVYKASVPRNICFGSGSQRGFHGRGRGKRGRHWHQTTDQPKSTDAQDINMGELSQALDPT